MGEAEIIEAQKYQARRSSLENDKFLTIALNLSGKREELENQAEKLIEEHGWLKAFKISSKSEVQP
jgi:hypothetical protein